MFFPPKFYCVIVFWSAALAQQCASAQASLRPINLGTYCNFSLTNSPLGTGSLDGANNLAALPKGTGQYGSIPFEISGIIQLTGHQAVLAGRNFPEKVSGIRIGAYCHKIHLLHGAGWTDVEKTEIAELTLHYANGEVRQIPIVYGVHVYDWWENDETPTDKQTTLAWSGVNAVSKISGTNLRIYKTTFANPKPGALVEKIDFVSLKKESAPFLLALTLE